MRHLCKRAGVLVGSMAVSGLAFAQATPIDVSDGVDQLTAAGVAIATIGGAMLVLAGIAAAYKWARAAFF